MSEASYIYEEQEYVLTGREAKRLSKRTGKIEIKVEIRPVDINDPSDRTCNKWVKMSELYDVIDAEVKV